MAAIRFGVSVNAAAAIANATLLDFGVVPKENTMNVIDAAKVQRAKSLVFSELEETAALNHSEQNISCIFFDGRKDQTLVYKPGEDGDSVHPAVEKEEHYSVVSEPGGEYLSFYTARLRRNSHRCRANREMSGAMDAFSWRR